MAPRPKALGRAAAASGLLAGENRRQAGGQMGHVLRPRGIGRLRVLALLEKTVEQVEIPEAFLAKKLSLGVERRAGQLREEMAGPLPASLAFRDPLRAQVQVTPDLAVRLLQRLLVVEEEAHRPPGRPFGE
ncbi:MAG: hypothetical protein ABIS20_05740 [Thermoanaerobaculia bacterium]